MYKKHQSKFSKVLAYVVATLFMLSLFNYAPLTYASTGDFSSDFVAAAPYSYDHLVGGGAFDDRTIGKNADVVESLEAGDFKNYDIVTFFHQIIVSDTPSKNNDALQTIEIDYSFLADSTGTSGAGFSDINNVYINRGTIVDLMETDQIDQGNFEKVPDSNVTIIKEELVGSLFTPKSVLKLTVKLDGLDYGEKIVVRIDAIIRFQSGANPTGNIAASVDAMRLVAIDGNVPVTRRNAISTGAQTVPFKLRDYQLPLISIVKTTYGWKGTANVWDDGVNIKMGDPVTWRYAVTNPGTLPLTNIMVKDDFGTPLDMTDDKIITALTTLISGDTDNDGKLDNGETWIYEYTSPNVAIRGDYNNIATATGSDGTRTTDPATDPSSYFGVDSKINIVKTTFGWKNLVEAYDDDVYINTGSAVRWRYVVTNTGNVALTNIVVKDDNGTPLNLTDDFTVTVTPTGDTNNDGILGLTETWTYLFTSPNPLVLGDYDNVCTVTGSYLGHFNATDTDPSSYFGVDSRIHIEKTTRDARVSQNGAYIDDAKLVAGQTVMWKYEVTNPGNYPMTNVTVRDDKGTVATTDDFNPTYVSGDTNGDSKLDPDTDPAAGYQGETWIYQYSATPAVSGAYTNKAYVQGTGLGQGLATDDDTSSYTGYNIQIRVTKIFTAGPFAATSYTTYRIENTSTAGTPDDFKVTAKVYDKKLGIDYTATPFELLAGASQDIPIGTLAPANTEQPYVDASITIFDDEATSETIHFYG